MNRPKGHQDPSPDIEEALKSIYQSPAPNEAFVERLERQLRDRGAVRSALPARVNPLRRLDMFWQRSRAALVNFAALAALLMLVVALMALFSTTKPTTTAPATSVPAGPMLMLHGSRIESSGPIGQRTVSIDVRAPLPQVPDRVPLYDVQAAFDQPSAELARSWAEKLGLKAVRLYQDTTIPEATYIAQADDGRFARVGPGAQVMYQARVESLLVPVRSASTLDPQAAQTVAEAFLNGLPDLVTLDSSTTAKITFRVEASPQQMAETRAFGLTFNYTVLIDGVPLLARGAPNTITVDAEGRVRSAILTPLRITPTGNEVTVQPVDAVVRAFLNNDPAVLRGSGWSSILTESAGQSPSIYTRDPMFAVGDNVTLKGGVQHWVAVDGGTDLYFVTAAGTQNFILEGEGLNVSAISVEIKGRIAGQAPSGAWRIAVASIQPIETGPQAYADWTGTLHRQTDGAWLETDSGQKYLVPDPPADLADGARIEAPGAVIDEGDGRLRLEWQIIYRAQPTATAGSGGSGSASAVVRQVIAPTQVITSDEEPPQATAVPAPVDPNGAPYSTGVFQSVTGSASGSIITPTLPAWWTYQPGDDVTLEGELSAQAYRVLEPVAGANAPTDAPARVIVEAYLLARKDGDPADMFVQVRLVGNQMNVDLARLSGLHIRVQGRLLSPDETTQHSDWTGKGIPNYGLEIAHYEKLRPDETKDVYSGHIRVEVLGGKEVAIFSDTLSATEYVIANSLTMTYSLEMYRQQAQNGITVQAIGVRVPDETFASRSVLRLLETRSSSSNSEEALQALRAELDDPVQDIGPAPDAPQDVIVDRVELAYVFQLPPERAPEGFTASPTEVIYELTGHSSDGRFTVTYDLDATSPTPLVIEPTIAMPTPAPTATDGPPPTPEPTVLDAIRPVTDRQVAIQLAIEIDRTTAQRDQPITEAMLAANPDMVTVERFASQAESGFGVATAYAEEPVWVVTFKGKGTFNLVVMDQRGPFEGDSVSYELLEKTGTLLGLSAHPANQAGPHLPWTADVTRCVIQDGASHGTDRHEIGFDLNMEPILAARDGTVIFAEWDPSASGGLVIKIQHDDGTVAVYQHLKSIDVKKDDRVAQGQPIGVSGSTGKVTGPRLAFAVLRDSVEIPVIFAEVGHELKTGECVVSQNR
jgi:hypothetical protein